MYQGSTIKIEQYRFTTSKGNDVKVWFSDYDEERKSILFYVNDTMDNLSSGGDLEVMNGVLWVVKNIADRKGYDKLTFRAISGNTKYIKGLDIGKAKELLKRSLKWYVDEIKGYKSKEIEPTEAQRSIFNKLGREVPKQYDVNSVKILDRIEELEKGLEENIINVNHNIFQYISGISTEWDSYKEFINNLEGYEKAVRSNYGEGYPIKRNRRFDVYKKLLSKYFSDWKVTEYGDSFYLDRIIK